MGVEICVFFTAYLDVFAVDWPWNSENCSYHHFLNYLNLSENKNLYSMLRPVRHHKITTELYLKMVIYAILDVVSCLNVLLIFFLLIKIIIPSAKEDMCILWSLAFVKEMAQYGCW